MKRLKWRLAVCSVICFLGLSAHAQKIIGLVVQKNMAGVDEALPGANVHWQGTQVGTTTRDNGIFMIDRVPGVQHLVISFVGMRADTVLVTDQKNIKVELLPMTQLQEVVVEGWRPSTGLDNARGINTVVMNEKELFKAACCNLSESFETNPSVDVAFTDAITGTKQIQMLGLAGPNTLIAVENMPGTRGLASSQGIQFIPGTWINSIEVTKGVGPVVNGYESIAGQVNVELKKPQESERLYLNGYINQSGRSEANVNYTRMAGKKWATTFLLHGSARPMMMDQNGDNFLDFPTGHQLNAINRWVFNSGTGWLLQAGVKLLGDTKQGGEKHFESANDKYTTNHYGFEINTQRVEGWAKLGYQFPGKPYKSVGLQVSALRHHHESYFGFNGHNAMENSVYANLIYQSIIRSTNHKFKTGFSFLFDKFDEDLTIGSGVDHAGHGATHPQRQLRFDRTENVPGAFFEYTYSFLDKVSMIAGARADYHNLFGTIFTPRLHTRFSLSPASAVRLSVGKGTRVANVLTENTGVLASNRNILFVNRQTDKAYGFVPDQAWNYGANFSHDFTLNYRPGTLTADYYFTDFVNQVVLDLDQSARVAYFTSLRGKSTSHSFQWQVDYQLVRRFDVRLAYRLLDVNTTYLEGELSRPLISRHRAFANLAYQTRSKWKFDYTVQWLGKQRIPDTSVNPIEYQLPQYSPGYVLMNAQVTKDFGDQWSAYLGVENMTNFMLKSPIIAADQPFSPYFDSSLVWGPVFGTMAYAGFRFRLN